jgi:hypothetical protein
VKYKIFGRRFEVIKESGKWRVYLLGQEGKKRPVPDVIMPPSISEEEIYRYLEDIFHEYETSETRD